MKSYRSSDGEIIGEEVSVRFDAETDIVKCQAMVMRKNGDVEVVGDDKYEIEKK